MTMLEKVGHIFERTNKLLAWLAGIVIIFTMLAITYEVFMRYFLNRPTIWVVEISEYGLLYITFLGTAWVLSRDGHVKIDILLDRLRPANRAVINIITSIIGAILSLVFAWYSGRVTWISFQTDYLSYSELHTPLFLVQLIIPIGSFLLFIQFVRRTAAFFKYLRASPNKRGRLVKGNP